MNYDLFCALFYVNEDGYYLCLVPEQRSYLCSVPEQRSYLCSVPGRALAVVGDAHTEAADTAELVAGREEERVVLATVTPVTCHILLQQTYAHGGG